MRTDIGEGGVTDADTRTGSAALRASGITPGPEGMGPTSPTAEAPEATAC
jgi:hypothetical protein